MPRDEDQVTSLPLIDSMHSSLARYGATLQLVEQLPAMVAADSIAQHSMAQHSKHGPAQHSVAQHGTGNTLYARTPAQCSWAG